MFATGETVGLAEWIIDDTYLVFVVLLNVEKEACFQRYLYSIFVCPNFTSSNTKGKCTKKM